MDDDIEKNLRKLEQMESLRQHMLRQNYIRTFVGFAAGERIHIEFLGSQIGNVQMEPDQSITGQLLVPDYSIVKVAEADGQALLIDRTIGLAVDTRMRTSTNIVIPVTIQGCVSVGQEFAYTFAEEMVSHEDYHPLPLSQVNHLALRYGRVTVGEVVYADIITPMI